jgi:ADP-heptose:LPS heptosyltransferase
VRRCDDALRSERGRLIGSPARGRVAVLRALQLGDVLCAVPALRALRRACPRAEITLLGLPWMAALAQRLRRYVDDVLVVPGHPGLPEQPAAAPQWPRFLEHAQARRFDLVIQLHGSGVVTNPLVPLLGARRSAGFFTPGGYCPDADSFLPYPDHGPEVRRLLSLMAFLGAPPCGEHLEFPPEPADEPELHDVLGAAAGERGYVCIHPGGRAVGRRWAADRFARVGDALAEDGLAAVLTGSSEETAVTAAVARAMRAPAVDLAGRTSLGALAALLRGARLVVSNDTGVAHLADAVGTPSVVLFAPTELERWAPLDRARHRPLSPSLDVTADVAVATARELLDREAACVPSVS